MRKFRKKESILYATLIEILCDYNNTKYLQITGKNNFDDIRGTKLWKLWYGTHELDFCVRTLEHNIELYNYGLLEEKVFKNQIFYLRDNLKEQFELLKRKET